MIESTIIQYLISKNICGNNIFAELPANPPKKYIVVERTGGGDLNNISQALVAIRCVDETLLKAMQLSEALKTAMKTAPNTTDIFGVTLNSESNNTNTNIKQYRYLTTWDITY